MTTNFPFGMQDLDATRGNADDSMGSDGKDHSLHHHNEDDTIKALQVKVGIDNSSDVDSIDFLVKSNSHINNDFVSIKGGIKNGNFIGTGQLSGAGWIGDEKYGRYLTNTTTSVSASYLSSGGVSIIMTNTGGDNQYCFIDNTDNLYSALNSNSSKFIAMEAGAKYRFAVEYSIIGNSAGPLQAVFEEQNGDGTSVLHNITLSGNTLRSYRYIDITPSKKYGRIAVGYFGGTSPSNGTIINIYKLTLEKIIEVDNQLGVGGKPGIILMNDVSKYNIDQSQTTITGRHGFANGTTYRVGQSFVAAKKYLSGITFSKGPNQGTPTTDPKVYIHSDSGGLPGNILGALNVTSAVWNSIPDNTDYFANIPCILTPGNTYWIVFDAPQNSVNYRTININHNGGYSAGMIETYDGSSWVSGISDIYFKTHYLKKLQNADIKINGIKTSLTTDQDGILNHSTLDLNRGKYIYKSGILNWANLSNISNFAHNVYSASDGGNTMSNGYITVINRWGNNGVDSGIFGASDSSERYIVFKVNTFLPIKGANFEVGFGRDASFKFQVSADNSTRTNLLSGTSQETTMQSIQTNILNGLSTFYIRFYKGAISNYLVIRSLEMELDLDISTMNVGNLYPLKRNQFSQAFSIDSNVASYIFRTSKYKNEFGNFMPFIELNDGVGGTGNAVGYIPLKIDNSLESLPTIKILTTSGISSDTVLSDGQSVNLITSARYGKVEYLIGQGSNCDAITKNAIFASLNGNNIVSVDGPSHQASLLISPKAKGLGANQNDIDLKLESIINGKLGIKTKNDFVTSRETLKIGNYSLWIDSTGKLKMMQGNPSADTDGSYV